MEEQAIIPFGDLIHRIRRNNVEVFPLCYSPFLEGNCFKIDWLHAVDQGVGADFLGNFFYYVARELLEGANLKEKCNSGAPCNRPCSRGLSASRPEQARQGKTLQRLGDEKQEEE